MKKSNNKKKKKRNILYLKKIAKLKGKKTNNKNIIIWKILIFKLKKSFI